jgi:Rubisco accumulation factor 1 helix turn helix domain
MHAGQWHDLAKLLPNLARAGIDGLAVEQATGVERPEQNILVVAASVRTAAHVQEVLVWRVSHPARCA